MTKEGKVYNDLYLTGLEQKIIDARRNGAHITVTYYDESNYEEATDKVMEFGNIETIIDLDSATVFRIHNYREEVTVKAYLNN